MNDMFDIDAPKDENLVEQVRAACEEAAELQDTIKGYESAAAAAKKRLLDLTHKVIPTAMAEAGMGDTFSLDTGHKIKVLPFVNGSLPKEPDRREKAMQILEDLGGAALIKTLVEVTFPKGDKDNADIAVDYLEGLGYDVKADEGVHASSLKAFIKEKMADGSEVPLDSLGLYAGSAAKITPPKESK